MAEEIQFLDRNSEEVQDIIGKAPSWIIYRGNIFIAILIFALLVGAWLIKYPDIITAPVTISSFDPPVKLVAQSSGKIGQFYVSDGDTIESNIIIAVIDNPANTRDMLYLKKVAETIDTTLNLKITIKEFQLPTSIQVGEIQADYAALFEAINKYNFLINNKFYQNKLNDINSQKNDNNRIKQNIEQSQEMLSDQLKIEYWKDSVNKSLLKDRVISLSEYNEFKKGYLNQNIKSSDNSTNLIQNSQQNKEYKKTISDIKQQYNIAENDLALSIKTEAKKIIGQIGNWEKQFVLKSPIAGKVILFKIRKTNQYVISGTPIFMVVPFAQVYETRVQLPLNKAGKVKPGQHVLIKLREYPFDEFGMLKAKVLNITNVALDSTYSVELKLENGFKTTRNRIIELRPEITGTADIIINDKNVLQRIFDGLYGKINDR